MDSSSGFDQTVADSGSGIPAGVLISNAVADGGRGMSGGELMAGIPVIIDSLLSPVSSWAKNAVADGGRGMFGVLTVGTRAFPDGLSATADSSSNEPRVHSHRLLRLRSDGVWGADGA